MSNLIKGVLLCSVLLQIISSEIKGTIRNGKINYHTVNVIGSSQDMIVSSQLNAQQTSNVPVLLVSTTPLPNTQKNNHWLCGKVGGKQCVVPSEFIKNSKQLYIGVFCKNCEYSLNINFEKQNMDEQRYLEENEIRRDIYFPQLRLLQVTNGNDTSASYNQLRGLSVSGVSYLIIFIITCVIGCYIMMNIFVNPKLVKTPLKLGKIET